MGLLKTILFILLFFYAFKFLSRIFAPYLVKKASDTLRKKAEEHYKNSQPKSNVKKGETVIDRKPKPQQQNNNTVGEYVDFEEIDD